MTRQERVDEIMPDEVLSALLQRCVFVYGTLRRSGSNDINLLQPAARYLGRAQVKGRLYSLGAYPGMLLGGERWVQGEVYAIEPALEVVLDAIEGLGPEPVDEYVKREITVQLRGQSVVCLVYEIHPHCVLNAPLMEGGDWIDRGSRES